MSDYRGSVRETARAGLECVLFLLGYIALWVGFHIALRGLP